MKKNVHRKKNYLLENFAILDLNNYSADSIFRIIQTQLRILLNKIINK